MAPERQSLPGPLAPNGWLERGRFTASEVFKAPQLDRLGNHLGFLAAGWPGIEDTFISDGGDFVVWALPCLPPDRRFLQGSRDWRALYVVGFPNGGSVLAFRSVFEPYGEVEYVPTIVDIESQDTFRWVIMKTQEGAWAAAEALNNKVTADGHLLRMCKAWGLNRGYIELGRNVTFDLIFGRPPHGRVIPDDKSTAAYLPFSKDQDVPEPQAGAAATVSQQPMEQAITVLEMRTGEDVETASEPVTTLNKEGEGVEKINQPVAFQAKGKMEAKIVSQPNIPWKPLPAPTETAAAASPSFPPLLAPSSALAQGALDTAGPFETRTTAKLPPKTKSSWANIAGSSVPKSRQFNLQPANRMMTLAPTVRRVNVSQSIAYDQKVDGPDNPNRVVFLLNVHPSIGVSEVSKAIEEGPLVSIRFGINPDDQSRYVGIIFRYAEHASTFLSVLIKERAKNKAGRFQIVVEAAMGEPFPIDEIIEAMDMPTNARRRLVLAKKAFFYTTKPTALRDLIVEHVGPDSLEELVVQNNGNAHLIFAEVAAAIKIKALIEGFRAAAQARGARPETNLKWAGLTISFAKDPCEAFKEEN